VTFVAAPRPSVDACSMSLEIDRNRPSSVSNGHRNGSQSCGFFGSRPSTFWPSLMFNRRRPVDDAVPLTLAT